MWYLFQRGAQMLIILVVLSAALFGLLSAMPGNPVDLLITSNPHVKPEDVARLKKLRGLDKPWYVQYGRWLWGYHEPARPPQILNIDPIVFAKDHVTKIDMQGKFIDPNFMPSQELSQKWLGEVWPQWEKSSEADEIKRAINHENMPELLMLLAQYDLQIQNKFVYLMERESVKSLTMQGLFGAEFDGLNLNIYNTDKPESATWFFISNSYGQKKVGRIRHEFADGYENKLQPDFLIPIASQIVKDESKAFELDLKKFLVDKSKADTLRFELLDKSIGELSPDGLFSHKFLEPTQDIVLFKVSDSLGHSQKMAFEIENGVIGHKSKFNNGFLFFFTGDRLALGFSNTYKRPVYDLLFGQPSICGDGKIDVGETCDDGNVNLNDGCEPNCFKTAESFFSQADAMISGQIVSSGRIGNTVQLMLPAILLSLLIAIPLGVFSAYKQYSMLDYLINALAFVGISLPVFWFGIMMIYLFAEQLQIFPAGGVQSPGIYGQGSVNVLLDRLNYAVLPTMVLSIFYVGRWMRYMRASMLEVLPKDYIRTARAKGLSEWKVISSHAFRNALIPVVTVLALSIPSLFGGAVLTETVFSWPGVGRLQYESVMNNDYYVAIIVFLVAAVLVMFGNFLADAIYVLVDPRMRKK